MSVAESDVMLALLAALNVGGDAGSANAMELDEVKKAPVLPDAYTEVTLTRRFEETGERLDVTTGTDSFRASFRHVSKSFIDNAREMRRRTRINIEYVALTVGGLSSTPVKYESGDAIAEDAQGHYSGQELWTFTF